MAMFANKHIANMLCRRIKRGLLPLLFPFVAQANVSASLRGVHLIHSCANKVCLEILSPKADIGQLNGSYAFYQAEFKMVVANQTVIYHTTDMYYDHFTQKVYLHNITERPGEEAYYDLVTHDLHFLKKLHVL
jgi:hypothetical protein